MHQPSGVVGDCCQRAGGDGEGAGHGPEVGRQQGHELLRVCGSGNEGACERCVALAVQTEVLRKVLEHSRAGCRDDGLAVIEMGKGCVVLVVPSGDKQGGQNEGEPCAGEPSSMQARFGLVHRDEGKERVGYPQLNCCMCRIVT